METPIPVDLGRIAQDLQIRRVQVESVVQLLDEGNTVPFITRYRKERTGNLNEVVIREVQARVGRLRELAERKKTILKAIEAQGKLTDELGQAIRSAENPKRLEDLYLPYKPKKKTKASEAREKGLEPLALRIWNRDETLTDLAASASEFLNAEKGLETPEKVLEGVGHILSESINELAVVREAVRRAVWKHGKILTSRADNVPESKGLDFRDYFQYSEPLSHVPPHRVLAINRGDKENVLKVKLDVPRAELEKAILSQMPLEGHPHAEFFTAATLDALDRLLMPSLEREVRRDLTEMAERHAVDVFARNLRSLLLQPPIHKQTVLAIDPGFRTGCKVAVLDGLGNLLEQTVIHPHQPQNRRHEAKLALKDLVGRHSVDVVAIGNGTACRETEELVAEIIAEGTHFHQNPDTPFPGFENAAKPGSPASQGILEAESALPPSTAEGPAPEPASETPASAEPATPQPSAESGSVAVMESSTPRPEAEVETSSKPEPVAEPAPEEPPAPIMEPGMPPAASSEAAPNGDHSSEPEPQPSEPLPPIQGGAPDDSTPPEAFPPLSGGAPENDEPQPPSPEPAAEPAPSPDLSPESRDLSASAEAALPETPESAPTETSSEGEAHAEQSETSSEGEAPAEPISGEGEAPAEPVSGEGEAPAEPAGTGERESEPQPVAEGETEAQATTAAETPPKSEAPAAALTQPPKGPRKSKGDHPRPSKPKGPPPPPAAHSADARLAQLSYVIVNEAGASVYSASPVGQEEFPEFDAETRGTISIGRRLQDPLAELVKIEPQHIGVGLYQHDVNPKQLKGSLETVIESCVNFVGVDLNSASVPLLQHVSGLNSLTARRIADFRKEKGPFRSREQLQEVEGVGPSTFTQAAGFLKIAESENPLDRTWVHPESYPVAEKLLERLGFSPALLTDREQLPTLHAKLSETDPAALATEMEVGEPTLRDIFDALARPGRDPREDLPKPIFKRGVLRLEDLETGMELKGTVLNVVDFGAFVDIGLKDSGLVHISQLANRYVKSPHDVVSVGDVVTVWVMSVDQERKRVSLTMVKPGSERARGAEGPRGGGRRGGPQGEPGEPRRGGRPPRRGAGDTSRPAPASSEAGAGAAPETPRPGTHRIPGPPMRLQQGGRGGRGGRPGGGRGYRGGAGGPRSESAPSTTPTPRPKPKPQGPPPPLSKDALAGSAPLRTFGQLKQLYEAREKADEPETTPEGQSPAPETPPPASEPSET